MASICFVAGDPSGDGHAARLIEALKSRNASLSFSGLGGPAMQQAGMQLLLDLTQAAAIGPFDALRHVNHLKKAKQLLAEHLQSHRPDCVILVDFGDFNLPLIAPLVKKMGIPIFYYIAPQIWAWGRWRLNYVKRTIDRMLVLFAFEETFYKKEGIPVTWVGHPLVDQAKPSMTPEAAARHFGLNAWRRTVGLMPGSRAQEVARHLPLMLKAAHRIAWRMPGVQFILLKAPGIDRKRLEKAVAQSGVDCVVTEGSVYDALQTMEVALVASGTATLEAALCAVPMVVVYKTSWPTYFTVKALLRIPHIALANVVAQRKIVPEFVQHQATPRRLADALVALLRNDERRAAMKKDLAGVAEKLGPSGAVNRAAEVIMKMFQESKV